MSLRYPSMRPADAFLRDAEARELADRVAPEIAADQARDRVECRQLRHRRVGGRVERGMVVEPVPNRRHGRSFPSRVAATATAARRAAARVASMSSSRCASEGNSTSYGPGASAMPSSIIEWKNVG